MSDNSHFRIEDGDIVRLECDPDGDNDNHSRHGWVNVGAFAVEIGTDGQGDLVLIVYPCGNEQTPLALISLTKAQAMAAGASDCDAE